MALKVMDYKKAFPHYFQALDLYFQRDMSPLKKLLKTQKLDRSQKLLIKARLEGLNNNWDKYLDLLKTKFDNEYLDAQRLLLRGNAYLRMGDFELSILENLAAIQILLNLEDKQSLFNGHYHIAVCYSRLSLEKLLNSYLEKALVYADDLDKVYSIKRVYLNYYSKIGDFKSALKVIDQIEKEDLEKLQNKDILKNIMADVYFRSGNLEKANQLYIELKKNRKSIYKARIDYEFTILKCIMENKKLPNLPRSIQQSSEYFYLWKTLQALEQGDPFEANLQWENLRKMNPSKYLTPFNFSNKGDFSNHFSKYLEKLKLDGEKKQILNIRKGSRMHKLYEVMSHSSVALRKEVLIEQVWNVNYGPGYDSRFYKLIERLKKTTDLNIVMENSTYKITQ